MAFLKKMVKEAKNVLGDSEDKGRVLSSKLHPDVFRLFFYNLTSLTNLSVWSSKVQEIQEL